MSNSTKNLALIFSEIPKTFPEPGKHLKVEDIGFASPPTSASLPSSGGLVLEILYASFDPYLRGRLRDPSIKSYSDALPLGQPIGTLALAKVLKSNVDGFAEGDIVRGRFPIQQFSVHDVSKDGKPEKIDVGFLGEKGDLRNWIGALGMPGLTAYSSLYEIGKPKKGETIFVSSAAGAVGQLVGQLAKHEGLKVVGSVGSDEKLKFIKEELGFDDGFNYKKESTAEAFKRMGVEGKVDIYYDNVGGEQLDTSLLNLTQFGRIVACGQISQYNLEPKDRYPIVNTMLIVGKRLTMRGFIVGDEDFGPKYGKEHRENVSKWLKDGSFKASIHETTGIENSAEGFVGMLKGENFGKAVLKIAS